MTPSRPRTRPDRGSRHAGMMIGGGQFDEDICRLFSLTSFVASRDDTTTSSRPIPRRARRADASGWRRKARGADTAEVAAIVAATSALEGYAFHLVPEPGDRARRSGGGGPPSEDGAREARDPGTFRGLTDVVLLARVRLTRFVASRGTLRDRGKCAWTSAARTGTRRTHGGGCRVGRRRHRLGRLSPDFVRLSGAKYPGITFERLDVLEDTTFFADILAKRSRTVSS